LDEIFFRICHNINVVCCEEFRVKTNRWSANILKYVYEFNPLKIFTKHLTLVFWERALNRQEFGQRTIDDIVRRKMWGKKEKKQTRLTRFSVYY